MLYRIAVCLSGELRSWDYCKENIREFFESKERLPISGKYTNIQVDYFIHTWDRERNFFDETGLSTPPVDKKQHKISVESHDVISYYTPIKYLVEVQDTELYHNYPWGGFARSMYMSNKLKADYEFENGFEYDCVIRSRFDVLYLDKLEKLRFKDKYEKDRIYHDFKMIFMSEYNLDSVEDVFWFGSSTAMDKLADFYPWYICRTGYNTPHRNRQNKPILRKQHPLSFFGPIEDHKYMGPGTLMHTYMHSHFLSHESLDINVPDIVRPNAVIFDYKTPIGLERLRHVFTKSHIREYGDATAIIFDLDGVLVDTKIIHYNALVNAVKEVTGIDVDSNLIDPNSMKNTSEKFDILQRHYSINPEHKPAVLHLKDDMFNKDVSKLRPLPNIIELLEFIKSKNVKMAIASNSRKDNIVRVLTTLEIGSYFDAIVSGQDDVDTPKPHPELLYETYRRLGFTNKWDMYKTVFVEDSEEGAQAGYASCSTVVKINTPQEVTVQLLEKWIADR